MVLIAQLGLHYNKNDEKLEIYMRSFINVPPTVARHGAKCVARIYVIKNVRKSWLSRRSPTITIDENSPDKYICFKTLPVLRRTTTVFNEFFSCEVKRNLFHVCVIKIQFCNFDRNQPTVIAEKDFWIDEKPIDKFTEYDFILNASSPDLGELEISLRYLPSSERLTVILIGATNLRLLGETNSSVIVEIHLLIGRKTRDKRRSLMEYGSDPRFEQVFTFDLPRSDLYQSILTFTVIELIAISRPTANGENVAINEIEKQRVEIGRVIISGKAPGAEHSHWIHMINAIRESHTEVHKLSPC